MDEEVPNGQSDGAQACATKTSIVWGRKRRRRRGRNERALVHHRNLKRNGVVEDIRALTPNRLFHPLSRLYPSNSIFTPDNSRA